MIDRSFKIYNNWNSFHKDIEIIKSNLIKNAYPPFLIDKVIKKYLGYKFSSNQNQLKNTSDVYYFNDTHREKLYFFQFSTRMAGWLLLTLLICLHNQLSCWHNQLSLSIKFSEFQELLRKPEILILSNIRWNTTIWMISLI